MPSYYFVISILPPLVLGMTPGISFRELKELLELNLSKNDLGQVEKLLRSIDLYNIRAFWLGEPLDDRGNFNAKEIEEALLIRDPLPAYLGDYLERYETTTERLRYFASLYVSLYRDSKTSCSFLKKYYALEREMRLVLTALRVKESGRNLVQELQFEELDDPLIAEILAQKDSPDYVPPPEFEDLKNLFVENKKEPKKLDEAIGEYRFNRIEEMEEATDFSINRVLAYVARLLIAESWVKEQGRQQLAQYE